MADLIRPDYGSAWASTGEKVAPDSGKFALGWVQEMMPYQYENYLQARQDEAILYLLQKGIPEYSTTQEYTANKSVVLYNGVVYLATQTVTGVLPTVASSWKRVSTISDNAGIVSVAGGGTGATNANDARNNLGLGTAATVSADTIVFKSITGNAPAADKWTSPITLSLTGAAAGSTPLDGSGNATINVSGLNASSISSGTVPSSALTNATLKTSSVGSTILAAGLTSERDLSPAEGYMRWNKTTKVVEVFNGNSWTVSTNQSEAYLLSRANHTGTQEIATVAGLQSALDSKLSLTGGVLSGNLTVPSLNGGQLAGMRNKIINGDFRINQRSYVSGATTTAGQYTVDRWKVTGTGGVTFSTTENKTTITIPSGQTLQQVIEGLNLQTGTYVLSWEGTAQGRIAGGSYGASGSVTASITGGANTTIEFNSGTVANVQLEAGSVATPFEHRPYGAELALCQRYCFAKTGPGAYGIGQVLSTTIVYAHIEFPVQMRSAPTLEAVNSLFASVAVGGSYIANTAVITNVTRWGANLNMSMSSASFIAGNASVVSGSDAASSVRFVAEL